MIEKFSNISNSRTIGLSIYRIVLSFLVIKNMIFYYPLADDLFGVNAIFPYNDYVAIMHLYGFDFLTYPFNITVAARFFIFITFSVSFLFLFGVFKRVTGILLYICLFILRQRNGFILDGSDNIMDVTLPFLIIADSYNYFVYDVNFIKKIQIKNHYFELIKNYIKSTAVFGFMIQICFVYFFTGLAKVQGDLWLNGTAIYYTMRVEEFRATSWNIPLTESHYFVVFNTYFTLFWEGAFAFLIWFKQTKMVIIFCGIIVHFGIWLFMRIDNFSWIMIGTYSVFISNQEYVTLNCKILEIAKKIKNNRRLKTITLMYQNYEKK